MERTFGAEIASLFGVRLRRIYEPDEQGLPAQMIACLERLARAEQSRATATEPRRESPGDRRRTR